MFSIELKIILLINIIVRVKCDIEVTGRCGRPGIPAGGQALRVSAETNSFNHKDVVIIMCEKNEFPLFRHDIECNNGLWMGRQPRCAKLIDAKVSHLNIFDCGSNGKRLLSSQAISQLTESAESGGEPPRPSSFFQSLVTEENTIISANGSNCYTFSMRFERKVQIWFLLIDIWVESNDLVGAPEVVPFINEYRNCIQWKTVNETAYTDAIFGYYFVCDLKDKMSLKKEMSDMSDMISVNIKTYFNERVGLEAVFIGDIYRSKTLFKTPECGEIPIKTIGVDIQEEYAITYISCNDSFVDISRRDKVINKFAKNGNPKHTFTCNINGLWEGDWPVCVPIETCPIDKIHIEMDSSVKIDEIGNAYYLNESQWFAINYTFIRYSCASDQWLLRGNSVRFCLKSSKWSGTSPHCFPGFSVLTKEATSGSSNPGSTISWLLYLIVLILSLIINLDFIFNCIVVITKQFLGYQINREIVS